MGASKYMRREGEALGGRRTHERPLSGRKRTGNVGSLDPRPASCPRASAHCRSRRPPTAEPKNRQGQSGQIPRRLRHLASARDGGVNPHAQRACTTRRPPSSCPMTRSSAPTTSPRRRLPVGWAAPSRPRTGRKAILRIGRPAQASPVTTVPCSYAARTLGSEDQALPSARELAPAGRSTDPPVRSRSGWLMVSIFSPGSGISVRNPCTKPGGGHFYSGQIRHLHFNATEPESAECCAEVDPHSTPHGGFPTVFAFPAKYRVTGRATSHVASRRRLRAPPDRDDAGPVQHP